MVDERRCSGCSPSPSASSAHQALDRDDVGALVATANIRQLSPRAAVQQHGAGAALAVVTALLGAGDPKPLAQRVQQRRPGVDGEPVVRTVHPERDLHVHASHHRTYVH